MTQLFLAALAIIILVVVVIWLAKSLWNALKYLVFLPLFLVIFYLGLLQPMSKRMSFWDLPESTTDGLSEFSAFGDFTAKHLSVYRVYYNVWLPEEAEIEPAQKTKDSSI